ncbi:MAG: hypothetical protein ABJL99_17945 [Aliishimia sp.]
MDNGGGLTGNLIAMLGGLLMGGAVVWMVFTVRFTPNDNDYLVRAAGLYAQKMSYYGSGYRTSYRDCELELPEPEQQLEGAEIVGVCGTTAGGTGFKYVVSLDIWGSAVSSDLKVITP